MALRSGPRALIALAGLLIVAFPASRWAAGGDAPGAEKAGKLTAYRAARIIPLDGPDAVPGTLLVRGAKVERVLRDGEAVPAEAQVVDLGPATIIPGLVNPMSQALTGSSRRGRRSSGSGGGPPSDNRRARAVESLQPQGAALRRLGGTGYAAIAVTPSGSFLCGLAGVARPRAAGEREKVVIKEAAYLTMTYGLGQPFREIAERELGKAAQARKKSREEKEKGTAAPAEAGKAEKKEAEAKDGEKKDAEKKDTDKKETEKKDADKKDTERKDTEKKDAPPAPDPLLQAFDGALPVVVRVDSPAALDHFLRLLDRLPEPLSFILALPTPLEPSVVEKIASRKTIRAVMLSPRIEPAADTSVYRSTARLLHEAGVELALVPPSDDLEGHQEVLLALAEQVRCGLPAETALRAVTTVPSRLLGIEDRVGSLAPGREASFAVLGGDPLSGSAPLLRVVLEGEEVYREDPATGLREGEALR